MEFSIKNLAQSLADHLAPYFPSVHFYEDPNQQGAKLPCMFLQQRGGEIRLRQAGRLLRTIRLDLVYLEQFNRPDLQQVYTGAAEVLDEVLELFSYVSGGESDLLRTYDRDWTVEPDALHYKFELRVWVTKPKPDEPYMQHLTQNADYYDVEA